MEEHIGAKRVRDDSDESELDSSEVKRLRDDVLDFLDCADPAPSNQDLDSVMKSLQEEISASGPHTPVETRSVPGESHPSIEFLLEASDDELGLPPPPSASLNPEAKSGETESARLLSDSPGIGEFWEFEEQIPSYDSFGIGLDDTEYVPFDGFFDHSDGYCDSADFSESWRNPTP